MKNGEKEFDIQEYMTEGVERIVSEALKATLKNPRESAFMLKFAAASRTASRKRKKAEKKDEHIPPFLIARLRSDHPEMVYISFPGDEKSSGGCVAAGRGFFDKREPFLGYGLFIAVVAEVVLKERDFSISY